MFLHRKNPLNYFLFVLLATFSVNSLAKSLINFQLTELQQVKQAIIEQQASKQSQLAYQQLLTQADKLLTVKNQSVMDKTYIAMSGDKHDYLSLSRYWWPNPDTEDGLPWIRKDGETNPDTQNGNVDKKRIEYSTKSIQTLSFAYYFTGDPKYAQKGISWIRTWFLDENSKMNPNLEHAQRVPGIDKSRRSGILDGRIIPQRVLDAITLFSQSKYWTKQDEKQMNLWLSQYLHWLTDSELGQAGAEQRNNHGAWYCYQVAAIAYYLGDQQRLNFAVDLAKQVFVEQFAKDGSQPHELTRTRSYFYSTFNLDALTSVAMVANKAGLSFWDVKADNGATLLTGINYLIPASNGEVWPYPSKSGVRPSYLIASLTRIPEALITPQQQALLNKLLADLKNKPRKKYQKRIYNHLLLYSDYYL